SVASRIWRSTQVPKPIPGGLWSVMCPLSLDWARANVPRLGGGQAGDAGPVDRPEGVICMPSRSANVKNEKQYEALKDTGMSKQRAARIANSPDASKHGGEASGKGGSARQGGTTAQKKAAGRKGGKATARKT